jgi:hypothetical protein
MNKLTYIKTPSATSRGRWIIRQTTQRNAQFVWQHLSVRTVDQAGEKLVQLMEILVSEMDAD